MSEQPTPAKGEKGGECARSMCDNKPAWWYNKGTQSYVCSTCGPEINHAYRAKRCHEVKH